MAYVTTFIQKENGPLKGLRSRMGQIGAAIGDRLVAAVETGSRMRDVVRFSEMSDAELAVHGLTRDEIVSHVFRDKFCY
ncbi:DUF1127 domain-containing protein [Rhodobacter maris]|uniref:DUF1127 domain-containing protein n=1 Tax=Rhodobacter maris TaxID=446682 RepID=A0A285S357_9RHOB|nr:DUF1127 domain-containing protein [Rhodobacter maris]SOB99358.1 hypothetical protein SAMN05877831_102156 [Rhodobacter maris]